MLGAQCQQRSDSLHRLVQCCQVGSQTSVDASCLHVKSAVSSTVCLAYSSRVYRSEQQPNPLCAACIGCHPTQSLCAERWTSVNMCTFDLVKHGPLCSMHTRSPTHKAATEDAPFYTAGAWLQPRTTGPVGGPLNKPLRPQVPLQVHLPPPRASMQPWQLSLHHIMTFASQHTRLLYKPARRWIASGLPSQLT